MVGIAHLLTTLLCLSSLSATNALPQKRVDNSTCCGYVVTNRGDAFFNYKHIIDFSTLTSMDKVYEAGWEVSHGWQAGGENTLTGQKPIANENNVELIRGQGLRLKIPRQDKNARTFSVAEVTFPDVMLGAVLELTVQVTKEPGSCMGMFTLHADSGMERPFGWQDEQDIEILGSTMFTRNEFQQMHLVSFPSIAWFPTTSTSNTPRLTEYRFDGQMINRPGGICWQYKPLESPLQSLDKCRRPMVWRTACRGSIYDDQEGCGLL